MSCIATLPQLSLEAWRCSSLVIAMPMPMPMSLHQPAQTARGLSHAIMGSFTPPPPHPKPAITAKCLRGRYAAGVLYPAVGLLLRRAPEEAVVRYTGALPCPCMTRIQSRKCSSQISIRRRCIQQMTLHRADPKRYEGSPQSSPGL